MELDYENIFKISLRAMRINKSHPDIKRDRKWLLHFIFYHGIFAVVFILIMYNIIFHNLKMKDFDQTCKNGVLSVVFVVVTFQYCIMLWKQNLLMILMILMKKDYELAYFLPEEEQKIMYEFAKKSAYVCKQWLLVTIATCGCFPLKNIILLTYHWAKGTPKLIPLYDLIYPGAIENNKDNIYVYLALYAILLFYGIYAACMYTAFVPLGPSFMLHACALLDIVRRNIERLFEGNVEDVEDKLKEIIKQLQYTYSFVEKILLSFRVTYELTLKATTIILPITCYEVIEAIHKGEVALEFITFIVGGILISSSPCFYSDLLMEKGEKLRLAMYSCGWESIYKRKVRSTINVILIRAVKPVAIQTLFRTVCLEALTDLFQQSYAIFNLMNAMWK